MIDLYWFILQKEDLPPHQLYNNPEIKKTFINICPQTIALDKRTVVITMPYDLRIQKQEDGTYYAKSKQIVGENLWDTRPVLAIDTETKIKNYEDYSICHIKVPYVFMTEDKELTYYWTGPKSDTKHDITGVLFAEGMLYPGQYARSLDLAFIIPHDRQVTFKKGEPLGYLYFSKEINLKEIIPSQVILNYVNSIYGITSYVKGVSKIFKRAKNRYPYKELKNCEEVNE